MRAPEQLVKLVMADFLGTPVDAANVQLLLEQNDYNLEIRLGSTEIVTAMGDADITTEQELIVNVAEALQTLLIDESGKPWPEVTHGDRQW